MQSYSTVLHDMFIVDNRQKVESLLEERFSQAIAKLDGQRFFRDDYFVYTEADLPLPVEYGVFVEIPRSEYEEFLKMHTRDLVVSELITEWQAERLKDQPSELNALGEKVYPVTDDLPF